MNRLHEKAQEWRATVAAGEKPTDRLIGIEQCADELDLLAEQMQQEIEALPNYRPAMLNLDAYGMLEDPDGDFVRRSDLLHLFGAKEPQK